MAAGEPVQWSLSVYAPNKIAPVIFAVLYAISAIFHIWQCQHYKAYRLIGLYPLCAVLFAAGYSLREYGAYNYRYREDANLPLIVFILSQVFIYICPPLLELANYHILGRVFYYVRDCAPLPPGKVLRYFGILMALVETLNAVGVSLSANSSSSASQQTLGSSLTIAALAIQLIVILTFLIISIYFQRKCIRATLLTTTVKTMLNTLYVSMALILARCIYRLVEHTGDTKIDISDVESMKRLSPLLRHEAYFYVFEATLMLVNSVVWNIWHPGRYLPRKQHVYLSLNGTEVVGEEQVDDRPLFAKTANVVTFGLLFHRKSPLALERGSESFRCGTELRGVRS